MDLLVRYFDSSDDRVKVRFYDCFLGHVTYSDLMQQFIDATLKVNPNHIYKISMDDPIVNLKFGDCVVKKKSKGSE